MHNTSDSQPHRTANQLRLVVIIPVLVAVAGVILLAAKFSAQFRAIEDPSARDYPPAPQRESGPPGQPFGWAAGIPASAPQTNSSAASGTVSATTELVRTKPLPSKSVDLLGASSLAASTKPNQPAGEPLSGLDFPSIPGTHGIVGTVLLRGTPPTEKEIPMDPACGALHPGQKPRTRFFALGANGGLADVFVVLRGLSPLPGAVPGGPVEIRQRGCEYLPYVTAAHTGQVIRVFNDDRLMHNVHPVPTVDGNNEYNRAQLLRGAPLDFTFPQPEMFLRFKCDVHPWMFAYVSIVEHPFFAVTGADGQFALPEPPPGDYAVRVFHRKAGEKLIPIKVQRGQRVVVNVTLEIADMAKVEATPGEK